MTSPGKPMTFTHAWVPHVEADLKPIVGSQSWDSHSVSFRSCNSTVPSLSAHYTGCEHHCASEEASRLHLCYSTESVKHRRAVRICSRLKTGLAKEKHKCLCPFCFLTHCLLASRQHLAIQGFAAQHCALVSCKATQAAARAQAIYCQQLLEKNVFHLFKPVGRKAVGASSISAT